MSDVVSVALITAFATLIASLGALIFTNKSADKRLHARMQHEKEEAIRERLTKVRATYLEPLRDLLYDYRYLLVDLTKQMDIVSQSKNLTEVEKLDTIFGTAHDTLKKLVLANAKVTDSPLLSTLQEFRDLCLPFLTDIGAKLDVANKSQSFIALKGSNRRYKDPINRISQRIIKCNKRIEELLGGCDTS